PGAGHPQRLQGARHRRRIPAADPRVRGAGGEVGEVAIGGEYMKARGLVGLILACVLPAVLAPEAWTQARGLYQQTQYKGQEIGKLTGDVYYARMDDYVSAFMVTTDGIVLV